MKTRHIWVIGASSGIGEALALALAKEGASLILSARDEGALTALAAQMAGARVLRVDLAQSGSLAQAAAQIVPGSLDAIIFTAAQYDPGRVLEIAPEAIDQLLRVNIGGAFAISQLAPNLLVNGGQLVLFGSVAGYFGLPNGQPYSASKAAITNLAETLRIELAPQVDVRLVSPGFVRTRLTDKNTFAMPAIITPEVAAAAVLKGMSAKSFEIHFPRRFTLMMKLLRALPYGLSLRLTGRLGGVKTRGRS